MKPVDKYWICGVCADVKGWYFPKGGLAVTVRRGRCGWCEREDAQILIPVVDYIRPNEPPPVWD